MNAKYLLITLSSYLLSMPIYAASFDCTKANGFVETTICNNTELSTLDEQLTALYKKQLSDKKTTSAEQKVWLKKTRVCDTVDCLTNLYQERVQELKDVANIGISWKTYDNNNLGIKFNYSSNISVKQEENSLKLVSKKMNGSDYLIHFDIGKGDLKQAITNTAIFSEKSPNEFVATIGRFENPPAEKIAAHNWTGLKAVITCSTEDKETGFHAAGGECLWVLISDGKKYLLADTQGIIDTKDESILKTLNSIEFK